jgi:predicted nucleotidyltransferase
MKTAIRSKQALLSRINKNRSQIQQFGVKRLGVFGSFVREEQKTDSDVDILVEFEAGKKTFDNFMNLSLLLESLFNRRVELVTPEGLSPYFQPYILREVEYVEIVH